MAVDRDEFRDFRDELTKRLDQGFGDLNDRLDALNGRTRSNEMAIAVLRARETDQRINRWITSILSGLALTGEGFHRWWK